MESNNHTHDSKHNHSHNIEKYNKFIIIGIILNISFVLIEIIYGMLADSIALIADAGHNFSDVISLVLALLASYMIRKRSDEKYTYGYKKGSLLIAAFNSFLLLIALGVITWEAVHRFFEPVEVKSMTIIAVAAAGIVINGLTALLFIKGKDDDLNIKSAFLHMLTDAFVSAGVVVSGIMMLIFGVYWLDPVISLLIVVVIFIGTWSLFKETIRLSIDAVPEKINISDVRNYLLSLNGVQSIHDLHIWSLSTSETALTAHLVTGSLIPGNNFNSELKKSLHDKFGIGHVTIQVDLTSCDRECSTCN